MFWSQSWSPTPVLSHWQQWDCTGLSQSWICHAEPDFVVMHKQKRTPLDMEFFRLFPANYRLWKFKFSIFKASVSCWNGARKKWNSTMTFHFFFSEWNFTLDDVRKLCYGNCYYAFSATLLCLAYVFYHMYHEKALMVPKLPIYFLSSRRERD